MEFILNENYGMNGINKISLNEIIRVFKEPDERKIIRESELKDLKIEFLYPEIGLEVFYRINYYVDKDSVEYHALSFIVKKLFLTEEIYIKNKEDIRKVLEKIKKYHKKNKKEFEYEYEEHTYGGSYEFINLNITVYFEKLKGLKYVDDIYVDLPLEDDPKIPTLEEILYSK